MATATSEPSVYVAPVGAVFSVAITVSGEILPTVGTDERINRPLVDFVGMLVPPFDPALLAAEDTGLCAAFRIRGIYPM